MYTLFHPLPLPPSPPLLWSLPALSLGASEDMAQLLESYPEHRQQAGNVAKHVALMTELQRVVAGRKLMAVSECEQEIVCGVSSAQAAAYEVRGEGKLGAKNVEGNGNRGEFG